jgi:hypothetical protein
MPRVVPTVGQATPGSYITAAFWNAQVGAIGNWIVNPPRFSAYLASTSFKCADATFTPVILDTEVEDTEGGHSTTTNSQRYTAQVAGLYLVTGQVAFLANATGQRAAKLTVNGTTDVLGSEQLLTGQTANIVNTVSVNPSYVRLAVGDYVYMQAFQNSGTSGGLALNSVGAAQTQLACLWVAQ